MKKITLFIMTAVAAITFAACGGYGDKPATNNANANTNTNTAKPTAAAPTKEALMALEKSAWEAWKNKDTKFWDGYLSDRMVGFGRNGREDKAAAIKSLTEKPAEVKSYSLTDEQMTMLGADVAVLTFRASQDFTQSDGKPGPKDVWASSVFVREGDKWKNLMFVENPVVDPKAAPAKPAAAKPAAAATPAAAKPDTLTDTLMAIETKGWEAWKKRDKVGIESVMAKEFMYFSGLGRKDRAGAIALWADSKCEGIDYKFSDPKGVSITPDVSLVTYKADVKGTCDGKRVPPSLWVASFDIKEGDVWKNAFYTDVNR